MKREKVVEMVKEKEEMVKVSGVKGGRMYGEVLREGGCGIGEGREMTEKMEMERMKWVEDSIEREKRSGKVVEVSMDLQGERSEKESKKEEMVKELGIGEGAIEKMVVVGNRVKIMIKDSEVAEEIQKSWERRRKKYRRWSDRGAKK